MGNLEDFPFKILMCGDISLPFTTFEGAKCT